ncbi:MAG: SpoIIE family protein phosphatase [Bacteroidota bacterium]|nr:SpoIIE family protein phosphatase [Bacteroidota bacterium]
MDESFYIEVNCQQKCHAEARVCGDVFYSRRIKEEERTIIVLADGMGHGIKANILATLASTLAVNLTEEHKSVEKIASIIMNTLPEDSVRKMNFSTFTIVEINAEGVVNILEYENPQTLVMRGIRLLEPEWNCIVLETEKSSRKEVLTCSFTATKEDRVIFCSDGVVQSGLEGAMMPSGWGMENLTQFVMDSIHEDRTVSAEKLAQKVVNKANQNDHFMPRDDISCAVIYFREPRKLMLCTGPPINPADDREFAEILAQFEGTKIISGATTAEIISREWKKEITDSTEFFDPELPPFSSMEGVDIVTEGILTLSKVHEILKTHNNGIVLGKGPADQIVKMLLGSDEIHFHIGTSINPAHWDPSFPSDLEWRRTIVHRIARVLEEKFLKQVFMKFF